jgi:hypothetical protein
MRISMTTRYLMIAQRMIALVMMAPMGYFVWAQVGARLAEALAAACQIQAVRSIRALVGQAQVKRRRLLQYRQSQKPAMIMSEDAYASFIALILLNHHFLAELLLAFQPIFAAVRCLAIQRKIVPQWPWQHLRPTTSRACADVFAAQSLPESIAMQTAFRMGLADI